MLIETTSRIFNHARRIALNARVRELRQQIGSHADHSVREHIHSLEEGKKKKPRQLLNYFNSLPDSKRNKVESHIARIHQVRRGEQEAFLIPRYVAKYHITEYQASILAEWNINHTRSRMLQIVDYGKDHNTIPFNADDHVQGVKKLHPIVLSRTPPQWWVGQY